MPNAPSIHDMFSWNVLTPYYKETVTLGKEELETRSDALGVSRRHLEASRRHLGGIGRHLGGIWHSRRPWGSRRPWEQLLQYLFI